MRRARSVVAGALLLLASAAWVPRAASAQATGAAVDESAASALFVNPGNPQASDANPGTRELPFRTISQAVSSALKRRARNTASRIEIYPGVYRESIDLGPGGNRNAAPIILEGAGNGRVTISGANSWVGWRPLKPGVWTHQWPYAWGETALPAGWESQHLKPIVLRREMIFVDGRALEQVVAPGAMQDQAGTFYVDEASRAIYIHPPAGLDAATANVEVAERASLLRIHGQSNIVVRGLTFVDSNAFLQDAAVTVDNSFAIVIDNCAMDWNNWMGLSVRNSNVVTVEHSRANFNGGAGMTLWRVTNLLFTNDQTSHNNWRGAAGGFLGWSVAGLKSLQITNALYRDVVAVGNQSRGVWFDTDCTDIVIDHSYLCRNLTDGIFIEANQGPFAIDSSIICDNRQAGVLSGNSSGITLRGDILYGNGKAQISVSGLYDTTRPMKEWKSGRTLMLQSENWTLANDVIVSAASGQALISTTLSARLWQAFVSTLNSRGNLWFSPAGRDGFQMAGGQRLDLAGWRQATGHDRDSVFADPRFSDPAQANFKLDSGSPLAGRHLPVAPANGSD